MNRGFAVSRFRGLAVRVFVILGCMVSAVDATACSVCFGNSSSPLAKATDNGVLFLLVIIGAVQIGFVALFVTFWLRSRALRRRRESFHLIEGGAH